MDARMLWTDGLERGAVAEATRGIDADMRLLACSSVQQRRLYASR